MKDEHDPYHGEERREVVYVTDRPTERGITLNNIMTGLILVIAGWAANNVDDMNDKLGTLDKNSALNTSAIAVVVRDTEQLKKDVRTLQVIVNKEHPAP